MRLKSIAFVLLTCFFSCEGLCQGIWSIDSTDGFTPVGFAGSCVLGGKIYVVSGAISTIFDEETDLLQIFDPIAHTWSIGPSFPTTQIGITCDTFDGKIYAFGGENLNQLDIFDPSLETWSKGPQMPASIYGNTSSELNGKIYFIGGFGNDTSHPLNTVEVLDPSNGTWSSAPAIPDSSVVWLTSSVLNGKIYVTGGDVFSKNVYVFDPSANSWSTGQSMQTALQFCTSSTLDGKIYAIGNGENNRSQTEIYDPAANTLAIGPDMPTPWMPLTGMMTLTVNDKIYVIGGINGSGDGAEFVNEVFTPDPSAVFINQPTNSANSLQVFPNPASDILQITGGRAGIIHILDFWGREVLTAPIQQSGVCTIDISSLTDGMYFLRLGSESNKIEIAR